MITRETTPGKTYSVHTMNGCTIIEPDGWQKTIEAPDGYFDAHFGSVVIEGDDEASIKPLFKLAPQQQLALMGVLGGGDLAWLKQLNAELSAMLDGSQFETAWLAGDNTLIIHTDRVSDELLEAVKATAEAAMPEGTVLVQYNHHIEVNWRNINKYAECKTVDDILAVNPDYKNDLTSEGWWVYPLPNLEIGKNLFSNNKAITKFCVDLPSLTDADGLFRGSGLTEHENKFQSLTALWASFMGAKNFVKFSADISHVTNCGYAFNECPSLEIFESDLTKLSTAHLMFNMARLNKKSALRVFTTIPAYTSGSHTMAIGIHVDHRNDEEVLAAIANAEERGWTLTVQWNGTPTAQASVTYGLRKPPIYARVREHELSDGTTERYLDWGHYVTDPTGYEAFRSVETAREYFGLPAEPLTTTE